MQFYLYTLSLLKKYNIHTKKTKQLYNINKYNNIKSSPELIYNFRDKIEYF